MMEQAMMEGARKQSVLNALAPTAPNPSSREMERQHILIIELFRRLDALTAAITKQKPPEVNVEGAVVNVAAAEATRCGSPSAARPAMTTLRWNAARYVTGS